VNTHLYIQELYPSEKEGSKNQLSGKFYPIAGKKSLKKEIFETCLTFNPILKTPKPPPNH